MGVHDYKLYKPDISMIDKSKTFDNFWVGKSNQFAHNAALAVAENCGAVYNPLGLMIEEGLGSYHLICAMVNRMQEINPKLRIRVMSANELVNDYIDYIRYEEWDDYDFRSCFEALDCLVLTDINMTLRGKESTQDEVIHIISRMLSDETIHKRKRNLDFPACPQVILAFEGKTMKGMAGFESRLRIRFGNICMVDTKEPEFELKKRFIEAKAEELHLEIAKEGVRLIARCFSDFGGIESILHQCQFRCKMNMDNVVKKKLVEELLEHHF